MKQVSGSKDDHLAGVHFNKCHQRQGLGLIGQINCWHDLIASKDVEKNFPFLKVVGRVLYINIDDSTVLGDLDL